MAKRSRGGDELGRQSKALNNFRLEDTTWGGNCAGCAAGRQSKALMISRTGLTNSPAAGLSCD